MAFLGHLGPLQPLWFVGPLGPFWPNSYEAKRGQGGSTLAPKAKWAHLSQCFTSNGQNHLRTQIGYKSVHGVWQPSEATRPTPSKDSPPVQGKNSLPSLQYILKDQDWCIYGIIYHYEPFLLSNPMVTLSGPNYVITNQVPNPSPILKEEFLSIQYGNFLAATRRPFNDPNHLGLQELGCKFSPGLF
ncbi:hypothetical protein O181_015064 [Austropuccinia psidii MF-1]|uniref:Uncharacterized protein n=1 Tax=Austropuccinia psidii MF-1 TaxID=1389203 RepID=A0A9Q3BZA5_9BASI|nr:hypothetical protein [Austropuccinia psidii MF-1]